MKVRVDDSEFIQLVGNLKKMPENTMKKALPFYKQKTPIREGNARRNTRRNSLTINSDYGYAGRLDEGWSKQSPDGFTGPTIDKLDSLVTEYIKKVD